MKVFLKSALVALIIPFIGVVVALFLPPRRNHPDHYVATRIIAPLPATLRHVQTIYLYEPTMGEGRCTVAYSIAEADFQRLLVARPWEPGLIDSSFTPESLFPGVWPGANPEYESYHFAIGEARVVNMAVSRDHTKVIFSLTI